VTVVLLNVALMCTTARLTLRRVFRFLALATVPLLLVSQIHSNSQSRAIPGDIREEFTHTSFVISH
jgi:hypothetical protein